MRRWGRGSNDYARSSSVVEEHSYDGDEVVDVEGFLEEDRPLGFKVAEPRLAGQRSHNDDRDALILELFLERFENLNTVDVWHHHIGDHHVRMQRFQLAQAVFS